MLVNLFDRRHVGLIVLLLTISLKNMSFTSQNKLCKLCIPASNLRHALMSGVFSVLFKKRCQSVLCYLRVFFVCLFVLIYTVSRKSFSALAIPWSKWCVFPCWKGRKYKIRLPWIPDSAEELLFSSAVFWIKQTLYCLQDYLLSKAHNLVLSLWISSRPKISAKMKNVNWKEDFSLTFRLSTSTSTPMEGMAV